MIAGNQVVILAGGEGSRLKRVSGGVPKFLVPVDGIPFGKRLLNLLCVSAAPVNSFIVAGGSATDRIKTVLGKEINGVPLLYIADPSGFGTMGALRAVMPVTDDLFFIVNGDTACTVDFSSLRQGVNQGAEISACIAVGRPVDQVIHKPGDWTGKFGISGSVVEISGGMTISFGQSSGSVDELFYTGYCCIRKDRVVYEAVNDYELKGGNLEECLFPGLARKGALAAVVEHNGFMDMGTPERLMAAGKNLEIMERRIGLRT
jgi:NDP-sugar pyrophosphorylase family protein